MSKDICVWAETDEAWKTACGKLFVLIDGTPEDNGMLYCPYCGEALHTLLAVCSAWSKAVKFISLFAGIGGLDLGLERAGMECVAQVEIDDFCQKVLTKHWANVPKFKDVRDVGKHNLPTADLICGGFPCQDVSLAGNRLGLEGKRSTLWSEFYRIVCEIRPRWVIIENVSGLFTSDDGRFFTKILRELSESGYDVEWNTFYASDFGAPHARERVFIIANSKRDSNVEHVENRRILTEWKNRKKIGRENWFKLVLDTGKVAPSKWESKGFGIDSEPTLIRSHDGVSARLDKARLKSLGNAVVPQVAEFIGHCVMRVETCLTKREPDKRDSAPPQAFTTPEFLSDLEGLS